MSAFGPAVGDIMRKAIDEAWDTLSEREKQRGARSELAIRVLATAADGERDPVRLNDAALGNYYQTVAVN